MEWGGGKYVLIPELMYLPSFQYFKEFFSRCVTCPVYHQWVSELKAFVMRNGKMSLTNIIRPFDTCLTSIWIEGEFLEENNSFEQNLEIQSKHSFLELLSDRDKEQSQILTHKQLKACPNKKGHGDKRISPCFRGSCHSLTVPDSASTETPFCKGWKSLCQHLCFSICKS